MAKQRRNQKTITPPSSTITPQGPAHQVAPGNPGPPQVLATNPAQATGGTALASPLAEPLNTYLLGAPVATYGEEYQAHLLEQYKLFVEVMDKVSERRQNANTFFLTINTALVAMLGLVWPKVSSELSLIWFTAVAVAGMILCFSWYRILKSFAGLNRGKFDVIHAVEKLLPLRLFDAEWVALGRGEDEKKYLPFTHIETKVPWVFFSLYVVVLATMALLTYTNF